MLTDKNALGLPLSAYQGGESTLCAGCGHDSVSAAVVQACFRMNLAPEQVVKLSGIGCSSKTPGYFLRGAHGFNAVHGRMPPIATGAQLAQRDLYYLAVSGDGDSGSIGLSHFMHSLRRQLNILYLIENNGVYALTKGQFSAFSAYGARSKSGQTNPWPAIDPLTLALDLGASYVARGFSGDQEQLIPLIQGGLSHKGFALVDVISPCVTFNNHKESSCSYHQVRAKETQVGPVDYVPHAQAIVSPPHAPGDTVEVELHNGDRLRLHKRGSELNDREAARTLLREVTARGEILTGLLYFDPQPQDLHDVMGTCATPLRDLDYGDLQPGAAGLDLCNAELR